MKIWDDNRRVRGSSNGRRDGRRKFFCRCMWEPDGHNYYKTNEYGPVEELVRDTRYRYLLKNAGLGMAAYISLR